MTFERANRTSPMQFPLWFMEIGERDYNMRKRRLLVEPYAMATTRLAELRVWVEVEMPQYCYIVDAPDQKPNRPPAFRVESIVMKNSQRSVPAKTGLESIVIEALAQSQLVGDSAQRAVHTLFWVHFVEDDDGLTWLCKYASKAVGHFYASQRLRQYTRVRDDDETQRRRTYNARDVITTVMKDDPELGARMCQRVIDDAVFCDAIDALLLTGEDAQVQRAHVRRLIELNVSDRDLALASIVDASDDQYALRGLRACQRAERDTAFLAAIAAIAREAQDTKARTKRINAFLHKSKRTP